MESTKGNVTKLDLCPCMKTVKQKQIIALAKSGPCFLSKARAENVVAEWARRRPVCAVRLVHLSLAAAQMHAHARVLWAQFR